MPHLDGRLHSENGDEKRPLASEGPEVVCTEHSHTAPIALPSDRGLHVHHHPVRNAPEDAPQLHTNSSPLYSVGDSGTPNSATAGGTNTTAATHPPSNEPLSELSDKRSEKTPGATLICGLRRRTFLIVAILLALIIAATAIGGGVGGVYAQRSQSTSPEAISSSSTSTSSPSSPSSPSSIVDSDPPSLATANPDPHNKFSFQIWSEPAFLGSTQVFYSPGHFRTAFFARSYIWVPGQYDVDTMAVCSIAYCNDDYLLGWWGSSGRRQPGYPEDDAWGADNVVIECTPTFQAPSCPEAGALSTFTTVPVLEVSTTGASVESTALASGNSTGIGTATETAAESGESSSVASSAPPSTLPSATSPAAQTTITTGS